MRGRVAVVEEEIVLLLLDWDPNPGGDGHWALYMPSENRFYENMESLETVNSPQYRHMPPPEVNSEIKIGVDVYRVIERHVLSL